MSDTENRNKAAEGGLPGTTCSAELDCALALIKLGARRDADALQWTVAAQKMCHYCKGSETVSEAAARIIMDRMEDLEADNTVYRYRCEKHKIVHAKWSAAVGILNAQGDAETMLKRLSEILLPNA